MSILKLDGWKGEELSINYKDFSVKYLEEKASKLHREVEDLNKVMVMSKYIITTVLTGSEKKNKYNLSVKVKYGTKSEHEHKENSHRQEIDI
jgi:hypothetical protein